MISFPRSMSEGGIVNADSGSFADLPDSVQVGTPSHSNRIGSLAGMNVGDTEIADARSAPTFRSMS
jgi:hypothetical protein